MMLIDLLYIYMENSEYLCDILHISVFDQEYWKGHFAH